ncbi:MAG: OmpA family protein [Cyclobacteriaceae bacterium]|nr:OmpA family protein [Cyclobacteriaceae bacterium]
MRKLYLLLILLLAKGIVSAQESVIWASEVIDVSSEFGPLEFSALQVLHKPNVLPKSGENPNAWRPKSPDKKDFVMVAFPQAIKAKQVAIAETENPGSITRVVAYDRDYNDYVLFELKPRAIPTENRLLNLFFDETVHGVEIQAIRVEIDGEAVPGYNSIDAIGISASNIPITVLIDLAKGVNSKIDAEKLSENVNSTYVEHSPIISPDGKKLYFSRKYHPGNVGGVDDPEDIWVSTWNEVEKEWNVAVNAGPPLNTEGPNFISSVSKVDDKEMFILGNRYGKKGRMYAGVSMAYFEDGKFTEPQSIEVENEYNYSPKADFFLVPGGQVLLQAVERDDSYGGRDLYISFKNGNGWSEPKNIGGTLNSAAEEAAPFLAEDGKTLYFSSSGFKGYGQLDIYVSRRLDDTWMKWSPPDNLGAGINTDQDDQYFSIPVTGKHLYFTRGRVDDDTDIFRFRVDEFFIDPSDPLASSVQHLVQEEETIVIAVSGRVINTNTNEGMANVKVLVERLPDGIDIGSVMTNADGSYNFSLRPGARFGLSADLDGFLSQNENIDLNEIRKSDSIRMDLMISPIEAGKPIVMNNIFFAFDRDELTTASYPELERILAYMRTGKIQKIEIAGHTDSRGVAEYNLDLSRRRAKSVYNYFILNGIDRSRIKVEGFGESMPVASNETIEGRTKNRRVEFKVVEVGS